MRVLALYATTSGSTRLMLERLIAAHPNIITMQTVQEAADTATLPHFDLLLAVTPTYGKGDAHSTWIERGPALLRYLPKGQPVALLGLGDARGHPKTFAGGIGALKRLIVPRIPRLIGAVPSSGYAFEHSSAVEDGHFPGLVIEYRKDRRRAETVVVDWFNGVLASMGEGS